MSIGNPNRKETKVADNGPFEIQRAPERNNGDDPNGGIRHADLKLEWTDLPTNARSRNMRKEAAIPAAGRENKSVSL